MNDAVEVVPVRFGDVTVRVQTVRVAGTERTSAVGDRVVAAFGEVEAAIIGVASSVADTVCRMADAARPRQVQVQFGVNVSVEGNAVLVKGTTGAVLAVTLTYDTPG